jgi:hypothetical protein
MLKLLRNALTANPKKNDATRQAFTPNELVGYVKIPEVKEQSPSTKPAQPSIF